MNMNYTSNLKTTGQIELPKWRARVLVVVLMLVLFALLVRGVYLQGIHNNFLQQEGVARYGRVIDISAHRGNDHRPPWRAARHQHAGRIGLGQPGRRRGNASAGGSDWRRYWG